MVAGVDGYEYMSGKDDEKGGVVDRMVVIASSWKHHVLKTTHVRDRCAAYWLAGAQEVNTTAVPTALRRNDRCYFGNKGHAFVRVHVPLAPLSESVNSIGDGCMIG